MDIGKLIGGVAKAAIGILPGGGLATAAIGALEEVFGDDTAGMTPEQKMAFRAKMDAHQAQMAEAAFRAQSEAERNLTERISQLEGTAADLRGMPILGTFILFLRGAQRPVWGFGVIAMDFMVFSGKWPLPPDTATESAFWIINLLVLGFLFGERAVKNVAPLVGQYFGKGK